MKKNTFKVGDIVRHTGEFLRNTGQYVGAPINGRVLHVTEHGKSLHLVEVEWSDGNVSKILPCNIEIDPRCRSSRA